MNPQREVLILGGISLDRQLLVDSFPIPGQNVMSSGTNTRIFGPVYDLAVKLNAEGVSVNLVCPVGTDYEGLEIRKLAKKDSGIEFSWIEEEKTLSGTMISLRIKDTENTKRIVTRRPQKIGRVSDQIVKKIMRAKAVIVDEEVEESLLSQLATLSSSSETSLIMLSHSSSNIDEKSQNFGFTKLLAASEAAIIVRRFELTKYTSSRSNAARKSPLVGSATEN